MTSRILLFAIVGLSLLPACQTATPSTSPDPQSAAYELADACVRLSMEPDGDEQWVSAKNLRKYVVESKQLDATKFTMKASDLGTFLLYDTDRGYLAANDKRITRETVLESDVYLVEDGYVSGAEWNVSHVDEPKAGFTLQHRRTHKYVNSDLDLVEDVADAAVFRIQRTDGCVGHPELSLDATGEVQKTTYDDGTLYGFVDTHSHILTNFGFGGGGVAHGAAFHRLGVEHAMGDCELFHAPEGRADFLGWGFGRGAEAEIDEVSIINLLFTGRLSEPAHATDGWPTFSDWPSQTSATHQTQYWRWLERAWLGGLRLVVQHAVSNEAFCELMVNTGFQPGRWDCRDMLNIDRQLEEVHVMERYIDAQYGGPGRGFFRVVESPAEAREVIAGGKMAVLLGIEVPNLFDCYLSPREDSPVCDDAHIESQLDHYYDLGVRVMFPNHKYDNAFTPGDGHRGIVELGNFVTTSHWSNYVEDCPDVDTSFDRGSVQFGGLNAPRDEYLSEAPNPRIELDEEPLRALLPYVSLVREPALEGDWCQKAGLTAAGETLIAGMMKRGMIVELDHLPRRSYQDAFKMLEDANYPGAAGTHGVTNSGKLYELGGVGKTSLRRCADPDDPGSMFERFASRREMIREHGGFEAQGFGFDLNGLAGVPDSRFGPDANCEQPQQDPVTYPFTSFGGDVTFTQPYMGERIVDFNTEGMIHIGLVPELIEDARRTGVSDEDLDFVFKSAEGYIRMWEAAEARAADL